MARMTNKSLEAFVAAHVTAAKLSNTTYNLTRDSITGLLNKIGKVVTIENPFYDKLWMLDGEYLPYGKDIEEFYQNLIMPQTYDATGANTLAPQTLDYVNPAYSTSFGRKKLKSTLRNNDIERAVNNQAEFARVINQQMSRLYDSEIQYRYTIKKVMLQRYIELVSAAYQGSTYATTGVYTKGQYLKDANTATAYGVVVKNHASGDTTSWSNAVSNGYIVVIDLVKELALPTDATTGETFIEEVKKAVEDASFTSEGYSLNGNSLGSSDEGLLLIVKKGIMPSIEVKVMAGAFHQDKVALPVEVVRVDNFAEDATNTFAMLIDRRAVKLHNTYRAVRDQLNADGDFINYVLHVENTGYISRNTFVRVFKQAAGV